MSAKHDTHMPIQPSAHRPMSLEEQEYRRSLYQLERRAIIPLKWVIWFVTLLLWVWMLRTPPSKAVFIVFLLYFMVNCAQVYFFYFSTVTLHQIRPFTLVSYLFDVVFVTMLIYFDLAANVYSTDFYMLYFMLVLRGFALFRTILETIFVNCCISAIYILTFYVQKERSLESLLDPNFTVSLVLIWLVILMSWFLVSLITKQKMELLEIHEQLLRADSLARVGELAAGVAHEINNPIGIIAANAEYMKLQAGDDTAQLEELEAIRREAMRCKDIVQQMLTFANPRPAGITSIDARSLNEEVLQFVFPRKHNSRFKVNCEYDRKTPLFDADPNLIKQALLNIYMNAKQAVGEREKGEIKARIKPVRQGRGVRIEIEDNGPGIDDADREHIFDPFFTKKPTGTGLGLAVTQGIVEKCKGDIWFEPASPHGARFVLEFPASKD